MYKSTFRFAQSKLATEMK